MSSFNPIIFNPTCVVEQGVAGYISASFSGSIYCYQGNSNSDKTSLPAVVVSCKDAQEVYFNTRNYAFDVDIMVIESAADDTAINFSNICGNVVSLFTDSSMGVGALQAYLAANAVPLSIYQIQINRFAEGESGDMWVNTFNFKMIGALVPR